jgi:hypothetical protein
MTVEALEVAVDELYPSKFVFREEIPEPSCDLSCNCRDM